MGLIWAEIELINGDDLAMVRNFQMDMDEVKKMKVSMLVDTGAYNLCINEVIQEQLQLPVVEKRKAQLANGSIEEYDVVDNVQVRFKNRATTCRAMVLPGDTEPLFGAIPMEDMDLIIHPLRQELLVNPEHPYFAQMSVK
ncbi:MAG: retroviral-like aspartic protease family protein [Saprospiraceae bacterium]|jgi:clan AA aspartic protease|nr:retroviral-like aspartic protease family protein [Saprospiraceae bacterium]